MGGKNSKDDFYQMPPQTNGIKFDGLQKSPKSSSGFNNSSDKSHTSKQQMNFKYVHGGANKDSEGSITQQFDENNLMKPVKNFDNGTKMTLSKRQQNVLPQMTQRVLSKNQMILCKTPIFNPTRTLNIINNNITGSSPGRATEIKTGAQTQDLLLVQSSCGVDTTGGLSFLSSMQFNAAAGGGLTTTYDNDQSTTSKGLYSEIGVNHFNQPASGTTQKRSNAHNKGRQGTDSYRASIYSDFKKETSNNSRVTKRKNEIELKINSIKSNRRSSDSINNDEFESFYNQKQVKQVSHVSDNVIHNNVKHLFQNEMQTKRATMKKQQQLPYQSKTGFLPDTSHAHQILADRKKKISQLKNSTNISNFHSPPLLSQRSSSIMRKSQNDTSKFSQNVRQSTTTVIPSANQTGLSAFKQYTEKVKHQISQGLPGGNNAQTPLTHKQMSHDKSVSRLENRDFQQLLSGPNQPLSARQTFSNINQVKHHPKDNFSYNNTLISVGMHQESEIKSPQTIKGANREDLSDYSGGKKGSPMADKEYIQPDEFREFSFSSQVVTLILMYNMDEYYKYLQISAAWHCMINDCLDEYTNTLENGFIQKYQKYLNFTKSYITASPIYFCKERGLRIDRIFQCEILNIPQAINQTLKIAYDFEYIKKETNTQSQVKNPQSNFYHSEFRFDIIKKGQRRITWIHLSDDLPPYSQNEIQMQPGDTIEFSVCLFNMNGIINLETIDWELPEILPINQNEKDPLCYNRDLKILQRKGDRKTKIHINTNRLCEVEDAVVEWINVGHLERETPKLTINQKIYENRFKVMSMQFNELDLHYSKVLLQTIRRGVVESHVLGESILIHVKAENESICNEVKKRGVMFDRNKVKERIQMRVGDLLVVYESRKLPNEFQQDIIFSESQFVSQVSSVYNTGRNNGVQNTQSTQRGETSNNKSVKAIV